jgi:hypothetical protein
MPASKISMAFGEPALKLPHDLGRFGLRAFLIPLHKHGLHRLAHLGLAALGDVHQHVAVEVHLAALPLGLEYLPHRRLQAAVRIRHQPHPSQAALLQPFEELRPALFAFGGDHVQPEYFPAALQVHARGDHHGHRLDPLVLAHLRIQRIHPHVANLAQGAFAELAHLLVQRRAQLAHLACRHPRNAQFPGMASIFRVLTPRTTASWITLTSACSLRLRCSMKLGT